MILLKITRGMELENLIKQLKHARKKLKVIIVEQKKARKKKRKRQ